MMSAFVYFQPTLNKLFSNCISYIDIRLVVLELRKELWHRCQLFLILMRDKNKSTSS